MISLYNTSKISSSFPEQSYSMDLFVLHSLSISFNYSLTNTIAFFIASKFVKKKIGTYVTFMFVFLSDFQNLIYFSLSLFVNNFAHVDNLALLPYDKIKMILMVYA